MAYVQPNSIVQLFRGINLDNRYMHTIYFANESAQNSWFSTKVAYTFEGQSFQRYTRNSVKLKIDSTEVMDCTYLRFRNDRSVDKWFYAFINSVEYVNENTCLITYEIDVMQTWFIQSGTILPCYIERQHVNDDTFGINLEAEPVGSDVYDFTEISVADVESDFSRYDVVLCTTAEPQDNEMIRDGIVCGATYDYFPVPTSGTSFTQLKNRILQTLGSWDKQQQQSEIVDMFMFPYRFSNIGQTTATYHVINNGMFDNYTPKNNKLHSYPYNSLYITTNDGDTGVYKWEYFEGDIIHSDTGAQFELNATLTGGGYIELHPRAYNGVLNNYDAKLVMQNFPKCSWYYDAYQAWIASGGQYKAQYDMNMVQRKGALAIAQAGLNGVATVTKSALSAVSPQGKNASSIAPISKAIDAGVAGANAMIDIEQTALNYTEARDKIAFEFKDARYEPNILLGAQVPNIAVGKKFLGFKFYKMHIRDDEAKRIDDFFSVYGYAINKVETPNITGRQYWNFIKTHNAEIAGNIPSSSKSAIGRIFDGGIFFWRDGDNVGNFRQSVTQGSINNPII